MYSEFKNKCSYVVVFQTKLKITIFYSKPIATSRVFPAGSVKPPKKARDVAIDLKYDTCTPVYLYLCLSPPYYIVKWRHKWRLFRICSCASGR